VQIPPLQALQAIQDHRDRQAKILLLQALQVQILPLQGLQAIQEHQGRQEPEVTPELVEARDRLVTLDLQA